MPWAGLSHQGGLSMSPDISSRASLWGGLFDLSISSRRRADLMRRADAFDRASLWGGLFNLAISSMTRADQTCRADPRSRAKP